MNQDEKINSFSLSTIILSLCCSTFYGIFSSYIINTAKNASIISIIIGFIISIIISIIINTFIKKEETLTYTKKIKNIFPKTSLIINIISILCSIFGYILLTYRLTTFLSNQYLVETPRYLISLLILSLTFYTASKGFNTAIRVSVITFFISIAIFFFDFFSLISEIKIDNFLPLITVSYKNILSSSIVFSLYFSIPLIYLNIIPYNQIKDKKNFNKYYYLMIFASFIIILSSIFISIGVNGSIIISLFDYPVYSTLKRIKLFSILDSLENISYAAWFLFIINTSNMMLIYVFNGLKETFNIKQKYEIIPKILVMLITFSIPNFIFSNNNYNESYEYIYIPVIFISITLLIVIIFLIKYKYKKRTITSS